MVVNDDYILDVLDNLKVNMKGNGDTHHGSVGYYHRFGVVAKYGMKRNLSIGSFSEYKGMWYYWREQMECKHWHPPTGQPSGR